MTDEDKFVEMLLDVTFLMHSPNMMPAHPIKALIQKANELGLEGRTVTKLISL